MDYLVLIVYSFSLLLIFLFSLGQLHLTWLYSKNKRSRMDNSPDEGLDTERELPIVTVQLPLFNERYVAGRLIDAVAAFDYPHKKLEIQVLDDSTDDTREIVNERIAHYKQMGFEINRISREERTGKSC